MGAALVIFLIIRQFARPPPSTMNAQYQEMTNEYLKVYTPTPQPHLQILPTNTNPHSPTPQNQKTEDITGVSSEGYVGKGMVQSKPKREE